VDCCADEDAECENGNCKGIPQATEGHPPAALGASSPAQEMSPPIVHEVLISPGQPLDPVHTRFHGAALRL